MLEIIAWMILVFGFIGAWNQARNQNMKAFALVAALVFAGLLINQAGAIRQLL